MCKIRVLIVDDAVVVRRLISDVLSEDPAFEICGVAANGKIALSKIPQVNPDIVILDIEMPEMNGLEALREIRKNYRNLPVIMFSTLTEQGAKTTVEALALGASDYVAKPANVGGVVKAKEVLRNELIPKVKSLCAKAGLQITSSPGPAQPAAQSAARKVMPERRSERVDIVVVGVSTGGPNALDRLIPGVPASFPVPILIVQHMPPVFTKSLADRLNTHAKIRVFEAEEGMIPQPACAYLAPGDYHLVLVKEGGQLKIRLNRDPAENSCRPAADVLFRSAASVCRSNVLGVVMTGMGQDGLRGCQAIAEAGGQIIVQDEASSVVWGMPGFVARSGLADKILPLDQLGGEIVRRVSLFR